MVVLSDVFVEREQFEFMQDILLDLLKGHPSEDELVSQYLVVGLCKVTAVVGTVSKLFTSYCLFRYLYSFIHNFFKLFKIHIDGNLCIFRNN